ncbi:MAG: ACP S-malonyltransferase [Dehalococcoidia bacterium]|nr:ACP S-malonyltransferase [Dehalococcoidia bacterium]
MGLDLYQTFPAARRLFQEADEALDLPISRLCFEGPEETLRQTVNAQPAIMTVSLACLEAALAAGCLQERPAAFMAGHSLGEYTALVAASALTFPDGLRLVRERGRLMQEASERVPGTMAAIIGLPEDKVTELCDQTRAEVCNLNSPGQAVIGGTHEAVARAIEEAKTRGARHAIRLNVSGAFHTSLMRPAAEGMAEAVARTPFADAQVPIVANSTAQAITTAEAIRRELLEQFRRPVLWQRSVEYMIENGVTTFVEIGPGRVLTALIHRIDGSVDTKNIGDVPSIRREAESGDRPDG